MKIKSILLIISFFWISTISLYSQSNSTEVEMRKTEPVNPGPRTLNALPPVWINYGDNTISISFNKLQSNNIFYIIDNLGNIICLSPIICDGSIHKYNFITTVHGYYNIVIISDDDKYVGEIELMNDKIYDWL